MSEAVPFIELPVAHRVLAVESLRRCLRELAEKVGHSLPEDPPLSEPAQVWLRRMRSLPGRVQAGRFGRARERRRRNTLTGHFAVFDQWAEINSSFEGHFLEQISPTAFNKTFKENRKNMRVLFQHGKDPQVGDKPLGQIEEPAQSSAYFPPTGGGVVTETQSCRPRPSYPEDRRTRKPGASAR